MPEEKLATPNPSPLATIGSRDALTVRIAIIDSGINPQHPHVFGVAGGVGIAADLSDSPDYVDRLGHGTAVSAAIREKAPSAELYAVKVFDRALATSIDRLVAAIEWAADHRMHIVNLSLGTSKPEHADPLRAAVKRAAAAGSLIVAAGEHDGVRWLPGSLPGVVKAELDWECARHEVRPVAAADGTLVFRASGYPREIPGVPPEYNLKGLSFAVANVCGLLARWLEAQPDVLSYDDAVCGLAQLASHGSKGRGAQPQP